MFSALLHDNDRIRLNVVLGQNFSKRMIFLGLALLVLFFYAPELPRAQDQGTEKTTESEDKINYLLTQTLRLGENPVREAFFSADLMQIIALGQKGELAIAPVDPKKFSPLAREQVIGGRCWTPPVLANGLLYLRNARGDLVCLDFRK